jgi:NAD(P)H-quinone oxidoreductase subunit 5
VIAAPIVLMIAVGISMLIGRPPGEQAMARLIRLTVVVALICAVGVFIVMLSTGTRRLVLDFGDWVSIHADDGEHSHDYHFKAKLIFDRLSIPFLVLSLILCGTIGGFAIKYMHRESGFYRFFVLYSMFVLGIVVASVAGTIETLFVGWELVGLSSALLVSFFHERPAPARNGLRVWIIYRISDAALVLAAVLIHRAVGSGDFERLVGPEPWPGGHSTVSSAEGLAIGLLLILAAACKSALVPFSGWLPRAMEGPTPSSAIFYGAISVHAGAYLLLRAQPILQASPFAAAAVIAIGAWSAVHGTMVARVCADAKTSLAYSSISQLGLIFVEIGLGWSWLAVAHIVGHALVRTLQLLKAPSLLHEYHGVHAAAGGHLGKTGAPYESLLPTAVQGWLYRLALDRGHHDTILDRFLTGSLKRFAARMTAIEKRVHG